MLCLVFGVKVGDVMMMVGNLILLIDGVLVVLLVSEQWVEVYLLVLLVYFVDVEIVVVDYVNGNDGLLMVLIYVVFWLLVCNGLSLQDFDFYEIYEVFVFVVFVYLVVWEFEEYCKWWLGLDVVLGLIDWFKFNVNGLLLVVGYFFVVIGGWILVQIVKQFVEKKVVKKGGGLLCGLILICVVGG